MFTKLIIQQGLQLLVTALGQAAIAPWLFEVKVSNTIRDIASLYRSAYFTRHGVYPW